jgi:hypothetical protein
MKRILLLGTETIMIAGLILGMTACGGKQEVKSEATPEVAAAPTEVPTPGPQRYSVNKGDTLWAIAGKGDMYGDSFQWPLIFKANRDQIVDPDIIEIGQDFAVSKEYNQSDVAAAIENAKKTPRYKQHHKPRKKLPVAY